MSADPAPDGPLADIRVLDLAGEIGVFAGRMLAELGADVIRVEPPGGSAVRRRGPFLEGEVGPERSLYHLHFNVNKRGITLDIRRQQGAEVFRRLATVVDVVLETFAPDEMDGLGLGYESLRELNPALLYTTITPFGQIGPMRHYRGNDLVGVATSGLMWLNGFPEDPPNQPGAEQAYHMASLVAASSTLVALYGRDGRADGDGQRIDVSMQEATSMATHQQASANAYTWYRRIPARRGAGTGRGITLFRCADGRWVTFGVPPYRWDEFLEWLADENIESEVFADEWRDQAYRLEHLDELSTAIETLVERYPCDHLFHEGQRRRLLIMPTNTVAELVDDEQLRARDYFSEIEHETLGRTLVDTGVAYELGETPARITRPAPLVGEHNADVYRGLLGMSEAELAKLQTAGIV